MAGMEVSSSLLGALVGGLEVSSSRVRFLVFSASSAEIVAMHTVNLAPIVHEDDLSLKEQSPEDILESVINCIDQVVEKLVDLDLDPKYIEAIGLATERDTAVAWERSSGKSLYNAILWDDSRVMGYKNSGSCCNSSNVDVWLDRKWNKADLRRLRALSGCKISSRSPALKTKWLLDNVSSVQNALKRDDLLVGTLDSYLLYSLTASQKHVTDVTNASRTQLMNIESRKWDPNLLGLFAIPKSILPTIRACGGDYGELRVSKLKEICSIKAVMGINPASLFCNSDDSHKLIAMALFGEGASLFCDIGIKAAKFEYDDILDVSVASHNNEQSRVTYALETEAHDEFQFYQWLETNLKVDDHLPKNCNLDNNLSKDYFVIMSRNNNASETKVICGFKPNSRPSELLEAAQGCLAYRFHALILSLENRLNTEFESITVDIEDESKNNEIFLQIMADCWGRGVERREHSAALGVAMCAGNACGFWSASGETVLESVMPRVRLEERDELHRNYTNFALSLGICEEIRDFQASKQDMSSEHIWASIPAAFFCLSSVLMLFHASFSQTNAQI